jgi:hypothetical protein
VKYGLTAIAIACTAGLTACGSVQPPASADAAPVDGPLVDGQAPRKRVFVTSQAYTGNLGGLAGADAKCQVVAGAAGVPGTFKAWLSSATVSAAARLGHATVPYTLVDGTVVATSWTMLVSGNLMHAIDLTELGTRPLGGTSDDCFFDDTTGMFVWTNSDLQGTLANANRINSCGDDWNSAGPSTDGGPFGVVGIIGRRDAAWTLACQSARCEDTAPLYCIEQ